MLDGEVVVGEEEGDGIEVVLRALGKGVRPTHQAAGSGPQAAKPAFDVAGLALGFGAAAVGADGKGCRVGFPLVAARGATPETGCQRGPQVHGPLEASVTQGPAHDLAGAPTQGHPQPKLVGLGTHKAPEFIQLQHVAPLARQQSVHEGG